ncbi:MAG: Rrf2 family transcriptional regulator [Pseudomonadota bacterium]
MMKVSAKTRYAARILLALARAQEKTTSYVPSAQPENAENASLVNEMATNSDDYAHLCDAYAHPYNTYADPCDAYARPCDEVPKPSPVSSHVLAQETGVTVQFTEQILKALKHGGLTTSTRGAAGGHSLTRSPELISLDEVMQIMEGGIQLANCVTSKGTCSGSKTACERAGDCAMRHAWSHVTHALEDTLAKISLADLLKFKSDL